MISIHLFLIVFALVSFFIACLPLGVRFNLVALGLFLWCLATVGTR